MIHHAPTLQYLMDLYNGKKGSAPGKFFFLIRQHLFFDYFSGIKNHREGTDRFVNEQQKHPTRVTFSQPSKEGIMISRQWKGVATSSYSKRYIDHLRGETFPSLKNIPGFVSASILQRSVPEGEEFLIVTVWESIEAIKQFAGENPEVAVVPANVRAMMVEYEKLARHYEITETYTAR
jgi:heme-degrading monooxygenase HmoA